jgi:uncharacterized protein YjiS (DUF1127 family)
MLVGMIVAGVLGEIVSVIPLLIVQAAAYPAFGVLVLTRGSRASDARAGPRARPSARAAPKRVSCSEQLTRSQRSRRRFRCEVGTRAPLLRRQSASMPRFAPRYPDRLLALIEATDDEGLSLAEIARRVGAAAEAAGITRPSVVHVRRLVAELRERRDEERELRRITVEALADLAAQRSPIAVVEAATRKRERLEERARRR